jgi:hypothetical protein
MRILKMTGALGLLCAIMASACADSSRSFLPTAPSAVSAPSSNTLSASVQASSTMGSAVVELGSAAGDSSGLGKPSGNGNGNSNGNGGNPNANGGGGNGNGNPNGNGNGPPAQTPGPPAPKKVELEGLIEAIAGNVLTVNGQAVVVPLTVVVHHGSKVVAFADLVVGDRVHVRAEEVLGVLTATDVKLQNPDGQGGTGGGTGGGGTTPPPSTPLEVDGLISAFSFTACPNVTFTVGTQPVQTNSSTVFSGGTCNVLNNGSHVHVSGLLTSGVLVASTVQIF